MTYNATMPVGEDPELGWDTYCEACDWSGDIKPDNEDHADVALLREADLPALLAWNAELEERRREPDFPYTTTKLGNS